MEKQIVDAWNAAAQPITDTTAEALGFGQNFRIHVRDALKACWFTANAVVKGAVTVGNPMQSPADWLSIAGDVFFAVTASLDALRQKMSPQEYVACVVLSQPENGATSSEFCTSFQNFLDASKEVEFPWYLGLNKRRMGNARDELERADDRDKLCTDLLARLESKGHAEKSDDRWYFVDTHFEWGFREGGET